MVSLVILAVISSSLLKKIRWWAPEARKAETSRPRTRPAVPLSQIDTSIQAALERAGGSRVWVKSRPTEGPRGRTAAGMIEVVVASASYEGVLGALKQEAARQGLEASLATGAGANRLRATEVTLKHGGESAGSWRVREVPRLGHTAIVIDDLGADQKAADELLRLPYALTFSVLPHLAYSAQVAESAHRAGREIMLHLPMEARPGSAISPGEGALRLGMSRAEVARILDADLASVPYARGTNNHMGSLATTDEPLMSAVMEALGGRRLFFIDSRTTADSVAFDEARRQGVPTFFRSVFLDDTETVAYSLEQLGKLRQLVDEHGAALAIGHPHPTTITALGEFLPQLERDDIQVVPASEVVRLPEAERMLPPRKHEP